MKIIFLIQKISTKYCWLTAWRWPKVKLLTCHKTIVRAPVEELPSCRVSPATSWPRTQPRWQTQGSGFCDGEITFVMGYFLLLQKGCNCHNSHCHVILTVRNLTGITTAGCRQRDGRRVTDAEMQCPVRQVSSVSSLDTVTSAPASAPRPSSEQLLTRDRGSGGRHLAAPGPQTGR